MTLRWSTDAGGCQPWEYYCKLRDSSSNTELFDALEDALDDIEHSPRSAKARHRQMTATKPGQPTVWRVDVHHRSGNLQILWQEHDDGQLIRWIGPERF